MRMLTLTGILMTMIVLIGGAIVVRRLREIRRVRGDDLTDEMIRRIEDTGSVEVDEPLDWDEVREAEERFWRESSWDEPERW